MSHCKDPKPLGRRIYQQPFSLREKKCWKPTSNKLRTPKSVHTLPAVHDGEFALPLKHSKEGRLYLQTEFEGCILFSFIESCIQNICAVSLARETLRVSLSLFWTRTAPRIFTKLLKIPVSVLHRLNMLIIIYLDDLLLICHAIEEMLMTKAVIFILQQLGFVLNLKKSALTPTQRIEFLGVTVDSLIMTLFLPEKKVSKVQSQCL